MTVIDIALIILGALMILGGVVKPDFYWNGSRMKRRREILGDQKTQTFTIVMGLIVVGVGIVGALGYLG